MKNLFAVSLISFGLAVSFASAASNLGCKNEVEAAVENAVEGVIITGIDSSDGIKYRVRDAENQNRLTVTVDDSTCAVTKFTTDSNSVSDMDPTAVNRSANLGFQACQTDSDCGGPKDCWRCQHSGGVSRCVKPSLCFP